VARERLLVALLRVLELLLRLAHVSEEVLEDGVLLEFRRGLAELLLREREVRRRAHERLDRAEHVHVARREASAVQIRLLIVLLRARGPIARDEGLHGELEVCGRERRILLDRGVEARVASTRRAVAPLLDAFLIRGERLGV